jgi:hypothetical protein
MSALDVAMLAGLILLPAPSLIKHGNTVDLDIDAGSVQRPAEASARYLLAAKIVAEGVVEARKIGRRES